MRRGICHCPCMASVSFSDRRIVRALAGAAAYLFEFPLCWAAFGVTAAAALIWQSFGVIRMPSTAVMFVPMGLVACTRLLCLCLSDIFACPQRLRAALARLLIGGEYFFLCMCTTWATIALVYLLASLNFPLVDAALHRLDLFVGFDWQAGFRWMKNQRLLGQVYHTLIPQLVFIMVYFTVFLNTHRLREVFWNLFLALIAMGILSAFFPAMGPASFLGITEEFVAVQKSFAHVFADMQALRAGKNPDFTNHGPGGIITFPSFHSSCAILYIYALRDARYGINGAALALNGAMLVSIPFFGNHYLGDVAAGIAMAVAIIFLVRRLQGPEGQARTFFTAASQPA